MPALVRVPVLPPFVVAASAALALLLQAAFPAPFLQIGVTARLFLAAPFVLGGLAFLRRARRELQSRGVHPRFRPVATLVTSGPFSISRNPMYVGGAATMFGAALALNSAWLFLGMVPPLLYLELLVIPREEAALKAEFGGTFTSYCEDTPRWLVCFHHRLWR